MLEQLKKIEIFNRRKKKDGTRGLKGSVLKNCADGLSPATSLICTCVNDRGVVIREFVRRTQKLPNACSIAAYA